jgi:hypothetical protein
MLRVTDVRIYLVMYEWAHTDMWGGNNRELGLDLVECYHEVCRTLILCASLVRYF